MSGNEPATKSDIEQPRAETSHQYSDVLKTIRDNETKLLQAFYGYAASNDKSRLCKMQILRFS